MASNGGAAHQTADDLANTLKGIGLDRIPGFENASPELNPVELYRTHLSELLAPITGAESKVIYNAIQWTQTLDKGDCCLPVPALRIKGKKADETAKQVVEQVRLTAAEVCRTM